MGIVAGKDVVKFAIEVLSRGDEIETRHAWVLCEQTVECDSCAYQHQGQLRDVDQNDSAEEL